MPELSLCRSALFLPASNPRAIEKARELEADLIVLDLEDSVKPADKAAAREAAVEAVKAGFGGRLVAIRINGTGTLPYGEDAIAVRQSPVDYVVLPKVDGPKQLADTAWLTRKPILAMVETPRGVIDAAAIAAASRGLIAGTNDLAAELGIPPGAGRAGLSYALQRIVMAARAAGVPVFDGVHNRLEDGEGLADECEEGRAFGFDGKSLIHPSQIETANRIFGPSEEEIEAAQRLIAAAGEGAERHEGAMIESLHARQARRLLAKGRVEPCQPPSA